MKPKRETTLGRRDLLRALGAGAAIAAAAPLVPEAKADNETDAEKRRLERC